MNQRDLDVLLFINQVKICTTKQIQNTFFKGLHHSISYNKLNNYIDSQLIKRKYMNIEKKRNSYVYYYDKPPKKKNLKHDLLIAEFLAQLMQNNYEIISFKKTPLVAGIIPDAEIWFKKNDKIYSAFLEIQLSGHDCIKKYYNLKNKTDKKLPDTLYIISDKDLNIQQLRDMEVVSDNLEMKKINQTFSRGQKNARK